MVSTPLEESFDLVYKKILEGLIVEDGFTDFSSTCRVNRGKVEIDRNHFSSGVDYSGFILLRDSLWDSRVRAYLLVSDWNFMDLVDEMVSRDYEGKKLFGTGLIFPNTISLYPTLWCNNKILEFSSAYEQSNLVKPYGKFFTRGLKRLNVCGDRSSLILEQVP